MNFDWDQHNIEHIARHGITPADAETVLGDAPLYISTEFCGDEERITYLGPLTAERMLVIVITSRRNRVRVVTAFPANRRLRAAYIKSRSETQ